MNILKLKDLVWETWKVNVVSDPLFGSLIGHWLDFLIRSETDFFVKLWIVTTYFVFVFFFVLFYFNYQQQYNVGVSLEYNKHLEMCLE